MNPRFLRRRFAFARLAFAGFAIATFAPSTADAAAAQPVTGDRPGTLVLVSIDGARAGLDAWPSVAPALAALAKEGARFERATTPTPLTLPATASLLTGLTPTHHGLRSEALGGFREQASTLAGRLARGGFATLGLPDDPLAHARTGIARGFQSYRRDSPIWSDSARVDSALAFLARPGRAFVWLGFSIGQPAEVWRRSFAAGLDSTRYAGRARDVDECIARLMRGIARSSRANSAIIVVTGTHGLAVRDWPLANAGFDEPSLPGHGLDLSEASVRVPLIFAGRPVAAHRGSHRLPADWTSTLDVAPTLLAAAGLETSGCDGVSLWPVLAGNPLPSRVLVHETDVHRSFGWQPRAAARLGDRKLESYGGRTLLLRSTDSALPPAPPGTEPKLAEAVRTASPEKTAPSKTTAAPDSAAAIRDAENAVARALQTSLPAPGATVDTLAMKALYQLSRDHSDDLMLAIESAAMGSLAGSDDAVAAVFVNIVDHHPEFPEATLAYGDHLLRHDHAEFVADQMLKVSTRSPFVIEAMWRDVIAHTSRLEFDAALATLDRNPDFCAPPGRLFRDARTSLRVLADLRAKVTANPDTERFRIEYGKALGAFGLIDAAYQQLNQARVLNPADPEPNLNMGDLLYEQGKYEPARNAYQRVVDLDRDNARGWIGIADSWLAEDRKREALPALLRAAETAPKDGRVRYNLACVLASQGQVDRAASELAKSIDLGYADWTRIEQDEDLNPVRATAAYRQMKARAPAHP
jgi:choline-sulfatase